ncbi:MAG: ABC transporter substrate-binding protein, partial [Thermodesulfovibrionales bacterium]
MSGSVLITLVVIFVTLTHSLAYPNTEKNNDDIVLGMSAAFKGPTGGLGIELYRGSKAYLDHINEQGGIHG